MHSETSQHPDTNMNTAELTAPEHQAVCETPGCAPERWCVSTRMQYMKCVCTTSEAVLSAPPLLQPLHTLVQTDIAARLCPSCSVWADPPAPLHAPRSGATTSCGIHPNRNTFTSPAPVLVLSGCVWLAQLVTPC
jgi:hypothetical protein